MKKVVKYGLRYLGGLVLVVLLVVLLISLLIQVQPVKNKIADIAEKQASGFINGELSIGKIEGNFFTDLMLSDVLLTFDNDTLAFVSELNLHYNLLSLFEGTIDVYSATLDKPYLYLEQVNDSTWNIQQLLKSGDEKADTTKSGSINFNLAEFNLTEGHIQIQSPDTVIPDHIRNLNTKLSLYLSEKKQSVEIENFELVTENPDLRLSRLALNFSKNEEQAELSDFILRTAQNRIEGKASFQAKPVKKGSAHFKTDEMNLNEFGYFLQGMTIPANPVITIDGQLVKDSVNVALKMADNNQSIEADISSENLMDFLFGDTTAILSYNVETDFSNVDPGYWTGNPELDYLLNGYLNAEGRGTEPATAVVEVEARLNESTIEGQQINNVSANIALEKGNLSGVVQGNGGFGKFYLAPQINDLIDNPSYNLTLTAEKLNLAVLTGIDSLKSNLNLEARISGTSFEPERLTAEVNLLLYDSRVQQLMLDTLLADFQYANENVRIDSFWLKTPSIIAEAAGNYSMNSRSDIQLSVNFEGLEELEKFIPVSDLSTSGYLQAHVSGMPESLEFDGIMNLDTTRYDTLMVESLRLRAHGEIEGSDTLFNAAVNAYNLDLGEFMLDSVSAKIDGSPDSIFLQTQLKNQDLNTTLHAGIVPEEKLKITIPQWAITYKNQDWFLQQPPAYIELDSVNYFIDNFRLASGETDSVQFISMQGQVSLKGKEDFRLEIGNLRISQLAETLNVDFNGSGTANLNLNLSGTSASPLLNGNFNVKDAEVNKYNFTTLKGNVNYSGNTLSFESLVVPKDSGRFEISAHLPLQVNLDTMGFNFPRDDSLSAQVLIEEFSLDVLNSFNVPVQTTGFLEGEIDLGGTVNSPNPEGNVRLKNASFAMREYGIDYRDVRLNLSFLRDRIELDTFRIQTSDGNVTGTGLVNFGSDFYKGDITDTKIRLNFNGFNPVNHPQFNMEVDGNAELRGEGENVVFGGDLKIPQAEIYLPAIFRLMGQMQTKEIPKPILVQELENMSVSLDSIDIMTFEEEKPDSVSFDYFDQLKGELRLRIPRNTWIKNDDMRIEISGELEVIKNASYFELFGQVEVVRGQYELLGRAFIIEAGTINFEGGEKMNLKMDIKASYTFRNRQQVQQKLTVNVTGTPEEPEVNFELDGNSINEGDALSYILFGKSMDELTMNEQNNMESAGAGDLAQQAAASLVSAQLTNFLQNKLNVDYIEVKSEGGFEEASVVVGKYITNNLFVSYEQRFGQVDEQNMKKYEVKLEYELFRFLFFELNNSTIDSGFDIIFKFDVL